MLKEKGKPEATVYELDAYMGLEIAMSFNPVTEMKELCFESIRVHFRIHVHDSVPVERSEQDPLWHSRRLVAQIQKKFAVIAVPVGAVSLDERTVRTKARSAARTYLPSKPDKYGVRFYAVVGWESLYGYSVWDNGCGNRTRTTPAERYVGVFPELRTALFRTLERAEIPITRKDASALWVAMCGHLTKIHAAPTRHRLLAFTDGEIRMLGTVWISLQGKWNTKGLETAKARMDVAERGSWELVAALDVPVGWEKLQEKHKRAQRKLPSNMQIPYMPPMTIAANADYIVQPVLPGTSVEAVRLCCELAPLRR
ncbi:hypothetical protein PHMEG_0004525 [Phytophthora megakarya]|uniref:PiggyBac transposable element-derived protein domain-containing protein n=1 Tax=Phytophthora megakarya TaxID=4795 RepID=A0A225WTN2_9STRA|nr:hypothetical protein PHMEG_0004525 [Phytophthora megakarya]